MKRSTWPWVRAYAANASTPSSLIPRWTTQFSLIGANPAARAAFAQWLAAFDEPRGDEHQLGEIPDLHPLHDAGAMEFDRLLDDAEIQRVIARFTDYGRLG